MVSFYRSLAIILVLMLGVGLSPNSILAINNDELQIRYFDLEADRKSGDAILIVSPDGRTLLIDAGIAETGIQLSNDLGQLGIDHIDYAVATHPHHDHIGGYLTILEQVEVGTLLLPDLTHSTKAYSAFKKLILAKDVDYKYVKEGDRFYLGNEVEIEVLHPSQEMLEQVKREKLSTSEMNNLSLVLKVTYKNNTFLFTSDLYKKLEKELLEKKKDVLQADLLHAPHHGDRTSSSIDFIDAVNPKYIIISANILQSKKVINRYVKRGSKVLATRINGDILIRSDGDNISVITEKENGDRLF
ncbi:ComEC/Rec2 family competence protein [Halalkalibacter alkaliphilus]|uniref:MBL fold metallo-hydrolase n=1 Tax=Halalkalibacter alkaliphilus TaxID=2917993 RepID=A0A9X2CV01_9BACI|nr:MBL fold metallo-hydrolase [Halalkalibacter alkaliphilus]MCL7748826.1 MBL fold metallo-hydrolase [Halalkalibacter alkaliphilus]